MVGFKINGLFARFATRDGAWQRERSGALGVGRRRRPGQLTDQEASGQSDRCPAGVEAEKCAGQGSGHGEFFCGAEKAQAPPAPPRAGLA